MVVSGCSYFNTDTKIGLYVEVNNTDDRSHLFSVEIGVPDSDSRYTKEMEIQPNNEKYLGKVGEYEQSGEEEVDDVWMSVSVDSAIEESDTFDLTGVEYFVNVAFDGENISIDGGHMDA